jgi:AraC family transcriptional regulator
MLNESSYGVKLPKLFPMVAGPCPGAIACIERKTFVAARVSYDGLTAERTHPAPHEEAFLLCLSLKHQRCNIWLDDRTFTKTAIKHASSIYDLRSEVMVQFNDPFDFLYLLIPKRQLTEIADQEGRGVMHLEVEPGQTLADPVVAHLGACLLAALDDPRQANEMFLEHVSTAIQSHVFGRYVVATRPLKRYRSGLTARQLRIAKQAISENLKGGMCLSTIARECGLSPSHFTRAFAISVGQPPHRWLLEQRVDLARQLLSESALPLADIAIQCGFADQSHFTRVFSGRTGISPGRWRRVRHL